MKSWKAAGISALCIAALSAGKFWAAEDQKVDLKVGDQAPQFDATDDQGNAWKSGDHVGKKVLVVYFYPADLTGGCTKQACGFRDDAKELTEKGVEVVGISGDSVSNHQLFKKVHSLPFTLLADEEGALAKKFGVPLKPGSTINFKDADGQQHQLTRGVTAARWTFVIGKDGKILFKNTQVEAAKDSKAILALIEKQDK
jgi:peroxiredoxin Q/BCP